MAMLLPTAVDAGAQSVAQGPAAPDEPAEIGQLRRELSVGCRSRSGRAPSFQPDFLRRANLTPDGQPDFVVDVSGMTCPGAAGAFCRGKQCPVHVFVSFPGGYRRVLERFATGVEIRSAGDRDVLVFGHEALAWNGNRFAAVAMPPARTVRATPSATTPGGGPGWRLETTPLAAATSPMVGMVRGLTMFCDGPLNPVAELAFVAPMPARVEITLERGASRLVVSFFRLSPTEALWRADAHGAPDLARLLASASAPVALAVDGMPQGALTLRGADAALRQALGRCLRLPAR